MTPVPRTLVLTPSPEALNRTSFLLPFSGPLFSLRKKPKGDGLAGCGHPTPGANSLPFGNGSSWGRGRAGAGQDETRSRLIRREDCLGDLFLGCHGLCVSKKEVLGRVLGLVLGFPAVWRRVRGADEPGPGCSPP